MPQTQHSPSLLHRLVAVLGVGLVLWLSALAASPELHAWLHGHEAAAASDSHPVPESGLDDDDAGCVVTLFAHGIPALLVFFSLVLARPLVRSTAWRARDWLAAAQPRYWHVPSHAPPLV